MTTQNLVDVNFLSIFFSVEVRTIQLWAKGWPLKYGVVKNKRGKYDFIKVVRCRIKDLEEKIEELGKGDVTLYKLKQEHQIMANEEKGIRLKQLADSVIDSEAVRIAWLSEMKTISKSLMGLIPRLNVLIDGNDKTYETIKGEVDSLRNEIGKSTLDLEDNIYAELINDTEEEKEKGKEKK